jgi:hypothetical protein
LLRVYSSTRQLRHKINKVWKEDATSTKTATSTKNGIILEDTTAGEDAVTRVNAGTRDESITGISENPASDPNDGSEVRVGPASTTITGSESEECVKDPVQDRDQEIHDTQSIRADTSALKVLGPSICSPSAFRSTTKKSESSSNRRTLRGHRPDASKGKAVSTVTGSELSRSSSSLKRRSKGMPKTLKREQKRHHIGEECRETAATTVVVEPKPIDCNPEAPSFAQDQPFRCNGITIAGFTKDNELEGLDPVAFTDTTVLPTGIKDAVLDPQRVQNLLHSIDISWPIENVTQILAKDLVFHTLKPPCSGTIPPEAFMEHDIRKMKACAEMMFFSSILEDAFPLFLLVWIARRGDTRCRGTTALTQCARSATLVDDKLLVASILRDQLSTLDNTDSQLVVIRSLLYLELSELCDQPGNEKIRKGLYWKARDLCPSQASLRQTLLNFQQQMELNNTPDCISSSVLEVAFDFTASTEEGCLSNSYNLRDVLLAVTSLTYYNDHLVVKFAIRHLYETLKHLICVLQRSEWRESYIVWQEKLERLCPGSPRNAERALFFDLLENWLGGPNYPPWHDLSVLKENTVIGMSALEIISSLSALIWEDVDVQDHLDDPLDWDIGRRSEALSKLPEHVLLMKCLWCSVRRRRDTTPEGKLPTTLEASYRSLVPELFKKCIEEDTLDLTKVDNHPTMAESIYSSSTLSLMLRHARTVHLSHGIHQSGPNMTVEKASNPVAAVELSNKLGMSLAPGDVFRKLRPKPSRSESSIQASDKKGEARRRRDHESAASAPFPICTCAKWDSGFLLFYSETECAVHGNQESDDERVKKYLCEVTMLEREMIGSVHQPRDGG